MILFGGARLVGPASTYFGLGQFHLGGLQMFASVEESLRNALPCGPVRATFGAHPERETEKDKKETGRSTVAMSDCIKKHVRRCRRRCRRVSASLGESADAAGN